MPTELPPSLRWSGALLIVLALHATLGWLLLNHVIPPMIMPAAPDAVMLDLAPDLPPVQPAAIEAPAPATLTPPPAAIPEPSPPELLPPVELPPTPPVQAEAVLPVPPAPPPSPRPQPKPKPKPRPVIAERQPAPPMTEDTPRPLAPAPVQAAPVQATPVQAAARPPAPASTLAPSWRSELLARLQRAKRYPDLARSRGDQGSATVTFTLDRSGRVLSVTLVRSSGSTSLDDEAVALVRRAEPLPQLPDDMAATTITLTVPINFALR